MQNNQLWALRWHPQGFSNIFSAFILAEDTQEANYFWNKYKKQNAGVAHTWDRDFNSCVAMSTFHPATDFDAERFKKLFPRKRKAGVYLCEPEHIGCETDHVRD